MEWSQRKRYSFNLDGRNEVTHAESDHKKLNCFFPSLPKLVGLRAGMLQMVVWAQKTGKYFEPVEFDAVELMRKLPSFWMMDDLKEVPASVHSDKDNLIAELQ